MTTIFDHLMARAAEKPDATAFIFLGDGESETGELSFGELAGRALAIGARLARNTQPGDRVLLLFPPGLDFIAALYGCFAAGVIAVPVYPPRPKPAVLEQLLQIARNCGTKLALTTEELGARTRGWFERFVGTVELDYQTIDALAPASLGARHRAADLDAIALLQYTSGSTGAPKGVIIRHRHLIENLKMITALSEQTSADRGVLWLPPYHDMGLVAGILEPVFLGASMVLMPPASFIQRPSRWLRAIHKYGATTSGAPNFAFQHCLDRIPPEELEGVDLSSWRTAFNGAEPIRMQTLDRFIDRFSALGFRGDAFFPSYGMAETTLIVSGQRGHVQHAARASEADADPQPVVSCGRPASQNDVRCVDPNTRRPVKDGEVGEIWVRGPSVASGYWGQDELTESTFGGTLADPSSLRFLRTGDLGFLRDGQLHIAGRSKDMLIVRGRNLYPQDIERIIEESHPAFRGGRCAAFSSAGDGEEQLIVAAEVEREHMHDLDPAPVIAAARRAVTEAFDVLIHAVVLVKTATLPMTSSGKVRRFECRRRYEDGTLEVVAKDARPASDQVEPRAALPALSVSGGDTQLGSEEARLEIERWLLTRFGEATGEALGDKDRTRDLGDLGLDSLQFATLSGELSDWIGLQLPANFFDDYRNIERISTHLSAALAITRTLDDKDPDERSSILRSAQTKRGLRYESIETIPANVYDWSELQAYKELNQRHAALGHLAIPSPFYICHDGVAGATSRIGGEQFINFATNNYLAISDHPEAIQAVQRAVEKYGTSVSASRIVSGERPVHRELEQSLADFLGTDDALAMVSGNLTNTSVIGHLLGRTDLIVYDELSHDSMVRGAALSGADAVPYQHNNWRQVKQILERKRRYYERVLVFTEGTFSMDGDFPDLPKFVETARAHRAWLMVDEALSLGTLGRTGRGITEHFGIDPRQIDILMGVLSKSLASCGGYLAGNRDLVRYLRFTLPGHIYTTGLTGANATAAASALRIVQNEPWRVSTLQARAQEFLTLAQQAGLNTGRSRGTCVVPIIIDDPLLCLKVYAALRKDRINVQPIVYPAVPKDASRLRFFFSCEHTREQLRFTVERVAHHLGIQPARLSEQRVVHESA
jgi:8-amino-7-oxononanoate synthase